MNIEEYRDYCLAKEQVTEEFPFDNEILVFKVAGKIFALTSVSEFDRVNLKCHPERAAELRSLYPSVLPGYHMNKKHWNTILLDGTIPEKLIKAMIDDSYLCVINGLPKKKRGGLSAL